MISKVKTQRVVNLMREQFRYIGRQLWLLLWNPNWLIAFSPDDNASCKLAYGDEVLILNYNRNELINLTCACLVLVIFDLNILSQLSDHFISNESIVFFISYTSIITGVEFTFHFS